MRAYKHVQTMLTVLFEYHLLLTHLLEVYWNPSSDHVQDEVCEHTEHGYGHSFADMFLYRIFLYFCEEFALETITLLLNLPV